MNYSSSLCSML